MKVHLLSGFLGSGKTTAIQNACRVLLGENIPVGVIANDQGIQLVDGNYFRNLGIPTRQVVNGCFCCHYDELDREIGSLIKSHSPACIFAEAVGSCTDMVATVVRPLLRFRPGTTVTFSALADARLLLMLLEGNDNLFRQNVEYVYFKQLEEAGLILVNKIDLLSPDELNRLYSLMQEKFGEKTLLYQDSFREEHIRDWLRLLDSGSATYNPSTLDIDYDKYGEGEAELGWLDRKLRIDSDKGLAEQAALALAEILFDSIRAGHYTIGHLKYLLNDSRKISYTTADGQATADGSATTQGSSFTEKFPFTRESFSPSSASLLINARVQAPPATLTRLVEEASRLVEKQYDCRVLPEHQAAFQPGYPRPTHRLLS